MEGNSATGRVSHNTLLPEQDNELEHNAYIGQSTASEQAIQSHVLSDKESQAQSWGVELELVLAFHRSRLERILNQYAVSRRPEIVDDADIKHGRILELIAEHPSMDAHIGRKQWPSCVLRVPFDDQAYNFQKNHHAYNLGWLQYFFPDSTHRDRSPFHRTLALEPLLIAQEILLEKALKPRIVGTKFGDEKWVSQSEIFRTDGSSSSNATLLPGVEPAVVAQHRSSFKYEKWTLTRDLSVFPATQREIQRALALSGDKEQRQWISDGIELVSKTYSYEDIGRGCRKLARYLKQLEGVPHATEDESSAMMQDSDVEEDIRENSPAQQRQISNDGVVSGRTWGTIESVFAGTHVHIGMQWEPKNGSSGIDFQVLRHLAFLVIGNEPLITSLHPYCRRGKKTTFSPVSPVFTPTRIRTTSMDEASRVSELKEKYVSQHNLYSNGDNFARHQGIYVEDTARIWKRAANYFLDPSLEPRNLFRAVQRQLEFSPYGGYHGVLVDFDRLSERHKKYSNDPYDDTPLPIPTIEFRQHGCTLNAEEIEHWVKFLFALVRLAERRSRTTVQPNGLPIHVEQEGLEYEKAKYPLRATSIDVFCGPLHLDLAQDEIEYWRKRAEAHADSEQVYLDTTARRRDLRRKRKVKFGKPFTPEEIAELPTRDRAYFMGNPELRYKYQLVKYVEEALYIHADQVRGTSEQASAAEARRRCKWDRMTKRQVFNMAVRMENRLRRTGKFYKEDGDI